MGTFSAVSLFLRSISSLGFYYSFPSPGRVTGHCVSPRQADQVIRLIYYQYIYVGIKIKDYFEKVRVGSVGDPWDEPCYPAHHTIILCRLRP